MSASEVAKKYIGQTEKPANAGFNDLEFETKMKAVGFESGFAWCSLFAELVYKEAIPGQVSQLDKLFSASAVATFYNFQKAGYKISSTPVKDSLVIWQNQKAGKPIWSGHAGIVVEVLSKTEFKSIEGNTNDKGEREGYIVTTKKRTVKKVDNGLQVLGFIIIS
jgi:hypothetical protein